MSVLNVFRLPKNLVVHPKPKLLDTPPPVFPETSAPLFPAHSLPLPAASRCFPLPPADHYCLTNHLTLFSWRHTLRFNTEK